MKKTLIIASTTLSVGFALSGCFGSSGNNNQQAGQAQQGPAWKLTLQNKCADGAGEQCVGFYGFTVDADGKFKVGPGPSGQVLTGSLDPQENRELQDAYLTAIPGTVKLGNNASVCKDADEQLSDTVMLERQGEKKPLIANENSQLCFQSANFDAAKSLHDEIWKLANKYYALPFPDACAEASKNLEALYPTLQTCSTAADCTYVDLDYSPIMPDSGLYVTTQSGTKAQPMIVANLKALTGALAQLQANADTAANACDGAEMYATDGFYPSGVAPICVQGHCRIPQTPTAPSSN